MDRERFEKQLAFVRELDRLKEIERQTYLCDASRRENDAEHSWHLAVMALLLSEYAKEPVDVLKTVSMVLLHDVIEIDAGDTYAYDDNAITTKKERERKAADRLFSLLPEDQAVSFRALWDEFEEGKTPEALFALGLDRTQPVILNDASKGRGWEGHEIRYSQIERRIHPIREGSETLYDYTMELFEKNLNAGTLRLTEE